MAKDGTPHDDMMESTFLIILDLSFVKAMQVQRI